MVEPASNKPLAPPDLPKGDLNSNPPSNENHNHSRTRALWGFSIFLILSSILWFCYWYFYLQYYESTDDAYANGNLINVNSVIPGAVVAYYADDTDLVNEGQLLVQLDKTNYQATYEQELNRLASIALQVRRLYDQVKINQAIVKNKEIELTRQEFDYRNRSQLLKIYPEAVSKEDFFHSEQSYLFAQSDLLKAKSQLASALSIVGNTALERHPLIEKQKEKIRLAFYHLEHCSIYAAQTGYIAQRNVDVGQWITPTSNLMAIIPTNYVWVDANFKETQLTKMRIGQPATVWFDLYGSNVKYEGKVIGIASGTGSVFSLIPPQNATGNWIKIVQRLPVRISLDSETTKKFPVRLGISAEVEVDVTNQALPYLSPTPQEKFVSKTDVFEIQMEKLNQMMDEIVRDNFVVMQG